MDRSDAIADAVNDLRNELIDLQGAATCERDRLVLEKLVPVIEHAAGYVAQHLARALFMALDMQLDQQHNHLAVYAQRACAMEAALADAGDAMDAVTPTWEAREREVADA